VGASLRERWLAFRNRWLADSRFQEWATRFPLTRPIARRRTRELFDLCAGFVYSQVLLATVRLGLLERLREGPVEPAALAHEGVLDEAGSERLLRAAAGIDLVEALPDGRYALGALGAALLGSPGVGAMVLHHELLYEDLADPVALLRGDVPEARLGAYWSYAGAASPAELPPEDVAGYSSLMEASQGFIASQVLDAYEVARHRHLLDLGGGTGTFAAAAARRAPDLRVTVFDLPAVADRARTRFRAAGLDARCDARGGDFLAEPLPRGADLVSLVRVVHDHDDEAALALLRQVRAALPATGRLLLAEPMADTPGGEAAGATYFGLYLLAMGSGRPRTRPELEALLAHAELEVCSEPRTAIPLLVRVLVARPATAADSA
jgi:demethylspheroidene O-methyltransferase